MRRNSGKTILTLAIAMGLLAATQARVERADAYLSPTVTLNVNTTVDSATPCALNASHTTSTGSCSLRGAINTANASLTSNNVFSINVPAGTYPLSLGQLDVSSPSNIVQIFGTGPSSTVVNGAGNPQPSSVFRIDSASTIAGLTITGGTGNTSDGNGGGLWVTAGLDLTNDVITKNVACKAFTGPTCTGGYGNGGGIYVPDNRSSRNLAVQLSIVSVTYNVAGNGGGIAFRATDAASLSARDTHIDHNIACQTFSNAACTGDGNGGGFYNTGEGVQVVGGSINYNSAGSLSADSGNGGGVYNSQDTMQIENSQIVGNTAGQEGGGTWDGYQGNAAIGITYTNVWRNVAGRYGGGIAEEYVAHISHDSISGNIAGGTFACTTSGVSTACKSATGATAGDCSTLYPTATQCSSYSGQGGGIYSDYEYPEVNNSTVMNNVAVSIAGYGHCEGGLGGGIMTQWVLGLTNSTVSGNIADCGGGIDVPNGSLESQSSKILSNHALEDGGGIWANQLNSVVLNNTSVAFNSAGGQTGGVWDAATGDVVIGPNSQPVQNTSTGPCKNLTFPCR